MIIRFLILIGVLTLLGFNTLLDALNMGTSNTHFHRNGFLKRAIIRFILSIMLIYIILVSEFTPRLFTIAVGAIALILVVFTEFKFIRRSQFLKRFSALIKSLFTKYILLGLIPLSVMSLLVYYTNFTVYLIVLGSLIIMLLTIYILIYKVFIHKLVRLVPYDMVFEETLYQSEPSLKDDLFIVQSDKLNLPMNALFMGLFKMKRVLLTPKIVSYLNASEVKAIIYHELGHYHYKHLRKRLSIIALIILAYLSIGFIFFTFPVLSLMDLPYTLFNIFLFIGIGIYLLESMIETFMIHMMHKQEYEADHYVKQNHYGQALISALKKIKTIESETILHPLYQSLKVSHPSIKDRIKRLKG